MPVIPSRPKLKDLTLRVFDRALHPELYPCAATARLKTGDFSCALSLGEAGHVILISLGGESACETLLASTIVLPHRGQQLVFPLTTEREESLELAGVFHWETRVEFETYDRADFEAAQERWEADARRAFVSRAFGGGHRLLPPALSGVSLDVSYDAVAVQAWHTFPDNLAVCRVHSRFERL
jgi:Protein of unknown function DUF2617